MDTPPFSELGLAPELLASVEELGFETPSQIQALTIPTVLQGRDIVGLSQTGTGKTAAFALPVIQQIDLSRQEPQALILCPTRELCVQVCEEVQRLSAKLKGLRAMPVYGGAPIDRQFRGFQRGVHLVVGTPGRVMDHLRRRSFKPETVKMVVLDEADRMLDMGFKEDMEDLLSQMPPERQTLFFSATMTRQVEGLISHFGNEPEYLKVARQAMTVERIDQKYYEVRHKSKVEVLSRLLDMNSPRLAIVFCNTKRSVDEVTEALLARGYSADRLHGDISQQMRERVLARFKEGTIELLVATDVAARGLDVDDVDAVFNYDIPQDPEDYVHRIGRTGRAGRSGWAASFVFGRDIYRLQNIERFTKQKLERAKIPSMEEVAGKQADGLFEKVRERLENEDFKDYQNMVDRLLDDGNTQTDIASVLFTLMYETIGREGEEIIEDKYPAGEQRQKRERPQRERRDWENDTSGGRNPSKDRGAPKGRPVPDGMARMFINVGQIDGMNPGSIAGMIYNEAQLPKGSLGKIALFNKHCLVDVKADLADEMKNGLGKARVKGRPVRVDRDRF